MSKSPLNSDAAPGFTLIELMLATAILALAMVMLAGSFNEVAQSKTQAESHFAADRSGLAIMTELANDFRGAAWTRLVPSHTVMVGKAGINLSMPLDSITLSTLNLMHRPSIDGFGAEDLVSYTTKPNPHHGGWSLLLRTRRSALLNPNARLPDDQQVVLATNLVSFHFRYFDGARWNESWDSRAEPPMHQLPRAIAIELLIAQARGRRIRFYTEVTVPTASGRW